MLTEMSELAAGLFKMFWSALNHAHDEIVTLRLEKADLLERLNLAEEEIARIKAGREAG